MTKLKQLKCQRCEHEWIARIDSPKVCPNCRSPYWNTPRRQVKSLKKK
jgi:predicted Zn-ribbon and HTH transcriptional regulator